MNLFISTLISIVTVSTMVAQCLTIIGTVLGPVQWYVNGKKMVNSFYAEVKRFQKAPVIERIVLFKMHLILLIVQKQQELTHEFQYISWKIVSTTIF